MLPLPFQKWTTYPGHSGIDFPQPTGTKVPASGAGRITKRGSSPRAGNYVEVTYDDGTVVFYCHFDNLRSTPAAGARVSLGSTIGVVGSTGNSTGPHLHAATVNEETSAGFWKFFSRTSVVNAAPAATAHGAPPFPLQAGWYFGPKEGPLQSVSGYFRNGSDLQRWQQRMKDRGWEIAPDGRYGPQTRNVATAFQKEKGLQVDGRIGPETWGAAWTAPVT